MSKRISLDPKSLPMIFETCPPIAAVSLEDMAYQAVAFNLLAFVVG